MWLGGTGRSGRAGRQTVMKGEGRGETNRTKVRLYVPGQDGGVRRKRQERTRGKM